MALTFTIGVTLTSSVTVSVPPRQSASFPCGSSSAVSVVEQCQVATTSFSLFTPEQSTPLPSSVSSVYVRCPPAAKLPISQIIVLFVLSHKISVSDGFVS
ncbi:hypothetical protein U27_01318 [Candidatus Vecturithrix granuli]|uniref:Uncharacterized protein n=1 Tax=Vecturithrix granuli TaxID=1499967 RepID=A0A081CA13_VECG1|nr:hypothetical protein U27_01318 [Candidatus Vecturithrix granuli]